MIYEIIGLFALCYALWLQNKANDTTIAYVQKSRNRVSKPQQHSGGIKYNPYLGDQQLVTIKDRIFSTDITDNKIERKPSSMINGIYGITENAIQLNPADAVVLTSGPKMKLNI